MFEVKSTGTNFLTFVSLRSETVSFSFSFSFLFPFLPFPSLSLLFFSFFLPVLEPELGALRMLGNYSISELLLTPPLSFCKLFVELLYYLRYLSPKINFSKFHKKLWHPEGFTIFFRRWTVLRWLVWDSATRRYFCTDPSADSDSLSADTVWNTQDGQLLSNLLPCVCSNWLVISVLTLGCCGVFHHKIYLVHGVAAKLRTCSIFLLSVFIFCLASPLCPFSLFFS